MRSTAEALFSLWIHGGFSCFQNARPRPTLFSLQNQLFRCRFSQVMFGRQCFQERCCFRAGFMLDSCEMLLERMGLEFGVGSSEFVVDL